jgi:hypothetical protein
MPLHLRILRISDNLFLCQLPGIRVDFQRHFNAGSERKSEKFTHICCFKRLAPIAGSYFGLEIDRVARYWENWLA